jgi:hypothetical protein
MSRLRTDFYNDLRVEGDEAIADKDALALEFVDNADNWSSNHFWGPASPSFGIRVAQTAVTTCARRLGIIRSAIQSPFSK